MKSKTESRAFFAFSISVVVIAVVMVFVAGYKLYTSPSPNELPEEPAQEITTEPGEIFEKNGMLCAHFVARSHNLRNELGITCLTDGNFLTLAPVVIHQDNQNELVGIQAKIRREKIQRSGW